MTEPNEEKFFDNQYAVKGIDAKARTVHAVFSTDAIDGHGERVHQSFRLERFNANPVVLWAHNRTTGNGLPVGKAHNVAVRGGKLEGSVTFAEHAFAEEVWGLYRDGFLKAFSIGFRPGKVTEEKVGGNDVFVLRDNELFEISAVPIPSNEQALVKMKSMDLGHICPIWRKEAPPAPAKVGHERLAARLHGLEQAPSSSLLATGQQKHGSALRIEQHRARERALSVGRVTGQYAPALAANLEGAKHTKSTTVPNVLAARLSRITGGAA
jgi:HK97 family phage prohead protease